MLMKYLFSCILLFSCLFLNHANAFCTESYYIENNRVLLYKIINWWYDCLPEESNQLCGRIIKCVSEGDTQVEYNEKKMTLKLQIHGGFAGLLSIFKQCEQYFGPSYLKCTGLNKKYFGNGEAVIVTNKLPANFLFMNIDNSHSQLIKSLEEDIVFELKGEICGLLNGRIALHHVGNFLRTCPKGFKQNEKNFPTTLRIIDSQTKEELAKYSTIPDY